ncbi:MAG: UDP-N-acetylglucosamine--N-acetylmuramyl-(pentapeptide) pyrophosphoryl-undecaprenol N-acetylglucosamine transferase [Kiritimatiellaeota bacterium]|nr:UDP-N-acetylglucosamine--N-acetylmuramyl-(pentapeptide) pyrophosphoryl-undecaprenol N-acetylglucosamine transferase [Kiritimatiellota bacterium]
MSGKTIILCGGTGGHFFPGLTIAREIRGNGGEVKLLLSGKNSESQTAVAAEFSVDSEVIASFPAPVGVAGKIRFSLAFLGAWLAARSILRLEKPDSVLAMGSFTSLPASLAAISLKIHLYLHDGNARIGKANRFLSRFANTLFLAYPMINASSVRCPKLVTGMPVRPELDPALWNSKTRKEIVAEFNEVFGADFSADAPTLLIFGGSQGARTFNKRMPDVLRALNRADAQVVHLAGAGNAGEVEKSYGDAPFKRVVIDSSSEMGLLYSVADCVVCRSGGSTIAELALFAKFAVLIPFPYASEKHQDDNAAYYLSSNAAVKFDDDQVGTPEFAESINEILDDIARFADLGKESAKLAKPDAAELVASMLR